MFERYTPQARRAVFFARYASSQCGSPEIEPEHLLLAVFHEDAMLANRLGISRDKLEDIQTLVRRAFEGRKSLSTSVDVPLSGVSKKVLQYALDEAAELKHDHIGTPHLLLGISRAESPAATAILDEYGVGHDQLRRAAIQQAAEPTVPKPAVAQPAVPKLGVPKPAVAAPSPFRDLLTQAAIGEPAPLVGRERELERIIHVLSRRTRNNVVLIGEAGVGKAAIVEGLAQRMAQSSVPTFLAGRRMIALDVSALLLPSRPGLSRNDPDVLVSLPDPSNTILFVRGLFNLASAGPAWTVVEAMHALEPQLTHNGLQCIATGSPAGLRTAVERAGMLTRHFEAIPVAPVSEEDAIRIVSTLKPKFEQFHEVTFAEGAIETAVYASGPFLPGRHLPDRAIDLMDEAAVAVKLRRQSEPSEISAIRRRIRQIVRAMEDAIVSHDFGAAQRYSGEERKERETLEWLRAQSKPGEAPASTVSAADVIAAVAARAGVTDEAVARVLQSSRTGEFQRVRGELAAMPSVRDLEWLPFLAAYVARCSPAEAEALTRAIASAKAKLSESQTGGADPVDPGA
jgi:ATP-dependent Clp protease ATP-binding subunit ClpC